MRRYFTFTPAGFLRQGSLPSSANSLPVDVKFRLPHIQSSFLEAFKSLSPDQARNFLDVAAELTPESMRSAGLADANPMDVTTLSSEAQFQKQPRLVLEQQAAWFKAHGGVGPDEKAAKRYNSLLETAQTQAKGVRYGDGGMRHVQSGDMEIVANPETGSLRCKRGSDVEVFHREGSVLTRYEQKHSAEPVHPQPAPDSLRHLGLMQEFEEPTELALEAWDQVVSMGRRDMLSGPRPFGDLFRPPPDMAGLRTDLADVPVRGIDGQPTDIYTKLMAEPTLGDAQKARILSVLGEVRDAYKRLDDALPADAPNKGYQIVNWKHTRAEIDQVLESARLNGLSPHATEDALLGSMFSDSVKTPDNFAVHNVHGAMAAADVLPRYMDVDVPDNRARVNGITQAILEHQISPPAFMAMIISGMATRALGHPPTAEDKAALQEISARIAHPFDTANLTADGSEIAFSDAARQRLSGIGVHHWPVPRPGTSWYAASRSLIDGDCLINYSCPDGWAKIAAIRGPDKGPFFEDATVWDSLASAKKSYDDALSVMSPGARPLAEAGLKRTLAAEERVRGKVDLSGATRNADGTIPFWDAPLKYKAPLNELEQRQYDFAKTIRDKVVELLRAEQGTY